MNIQELIDQEPVSCPMCDSNDNKSMGVLGQKAWLRCNACGWDHSIEIKKGGDLNG